nr:MAG TPA: hypothetical protein [Crassvirales sp.]
MIKYKFVEAPGIEPGSYYQFIICLFICLGFCLSYYRPKKICTNRYL